ncbi:transposase [Pseudonocardia sp. DSM 110487]|nr:transposase [Pseudonocardia sp. DSM 110487]
MLDLAVTLALGGDCLVDIAVLRAEPGLFGPVASDRTVSRAIDRLANDPDAALRAINTARAAAGPSLGAGWRARPGPPHRRR